MQQQLRESKESNASFQPAWRTQAIKRQTKRYESSYSNPASIELAKKHQKAMKFGYTPPPPKSQNRRQIRINQSQAICGCCNFSSNNQEIELLHPAEPSRDKTYKLSEDVGFFFTFVKSLVLFVILHTVIYALFNIISSGIGGDYCKHLEVCSQSIQNKLAISNKYGRHDLMAVVNVLNLVAILASIAYLGWSRRLFYHISQIIDEFSPSQHDFTLFFTNLPDIQYPEVNDNINDLDSTFREKLKQYIHNMVAEGIRSGQLKRQNFSFEYFLHSSPDRHRRSQNIITSISLCYDLSDYQVLHDEKWSLIGEFQNNFILFDFCGYKLPDLFGFKNSINLQGTLGTSLVPQPKPKINFKKMLQTNLNQEVMFSLLDVDKRNQLNEIRKKVSFINESQINVSYQLVRNNKLYFHNTTFTGNVFVSFEFADFKEYIYEKYLADPKQFVLDGVQFKIEEACDPTDVYWLNMRISESTRQNKILFSYIVLVMLLICSFMILFAVELLKESYVQDKEGGILSFAKTQALSLITTLLILGANSLFDFVSNFLTNLQGHVTKTNEIFSQMIKSFFSRLINTVVLFFMISIIIRKDPQSKFLSSTGLVAQVYNFIVVSGLINLINAFVNLDDIWMRIKRWFIYSYRQQGDEVYTKFQITLNQEYQLPQFNLVYRYGDYLVTLYTALFYAYLVPIGIPTLIIIFCIQYWIDKFTLFKRCSLKNHFSYDLSIYVRRIFESSILVFALGNLIFSYYIEDYKFSALNIISLFIAFVYTICVWIAPKNIETKLFGKYDIVDAISYSQCQNQSRFKATYWNQNPATFCVNQHFEMSKRYHKRRQD